MEKKQTSGLEKLAVRSTRWIGSTQSLALHTVIFIGSFLLYFLGINLDKILLVLTTIVSLEAIYLAIFIQMSVNRQAAQLMEVSEDIEDIQEDVEEIQKDVETIEKDIDEIQEDVEDIQEDVEEIEKDIDEIQEDVEDIQNDEEEAEDAGSIIGMKPAPVETQDPAVSELTVLVKSLNQKMDLVQKELKDIKKQKPAPAPKTESLKQRVTRLLKK